jgi:hypothetical protein
MSTDSTQITIAMDLSKILLENVNMPSYNLTKDEIVWIETFIKSSPDTFSGIISDINVIISDGKINMQDVPAIVKLLSDIYHSNALNIKIVTNPKNIVSFIKFTFDVIIECELIPLSDVEKKIIESIVDSSLSLLLTNLPKIEAEITNNSFCLEILRFFRLHS